jgi:hypothetical protein
MGKMGVRSICMAIGLFVFAVICFAASASAATYYVDASNGNDANLGTSSNAAWKTLSKVNGMTFQPGDQILFKRGDSFTGQLWPKGSGTSSAPIVINTYGSGNMPLFNGNGLESTVYLYNQQYWEIRNLEIVNQNGSSSRRMGIYIVNKDAGTLSHIYLIDNNIHDIYGNNVKDGAGSAGIKVRTIGGSVPSNFNDVRIDGNTVGPRVDRTGIDINSDYWCRLVTGCTDEYNWYPSTNILIQNNYVTDVGGDGIVPMATTGALVQYNTVNGFNMRSGQGNAGIWAWNADHTIIQYNEAFNGYGTLDSQGYDVDFGQTGTVMQYNYSHNNDGGFMLVCNPHTWTANDGAIIRYNISQNDKARVFQLAGPITNTKIYNNTIYLPSGSMTQPILAGDWGGYPQTVSMYNNIWHMENAGAWSGLSTIANFDFRYNTIYGAHTSGEPSDPNKMTGNPMLADPGQGINRTSVDGYKLLQNSPALGSGMLISGNGGSDYWGNPVSATLAPNRGAYNGPAVQGVPNSSIVKNGGFETGALSPWGNWNTASVVNANARSGSYALRLNGGPGASEQTVTLSPNTTYTFSGYAFTTNSGEPVHIGVKNYGGSEQYVSIASTSYTSNSVTFTTGSTNTSAVIYIYKPSGSAAAYADDIKVVKN